jgi:hypothetical protein
MTDTDFHTVVLAYTDLDDGVWLECNDCPWKHNLGFSATPEEAVEAARAHRGDIAAARPDALCRAIRWNGEPVHHGPHEPHAFTYGPNGVYMGHCGGRR